MMVMLPRVGRSCGGSRRRSSLPAGVITAALALFLAASPGLRLAAATSSSTSMEGSSGFDAEATDDISDADSGDDSTSSLSTSFPATSVPIPTPESVTSTDAPAAAPTAVPAAAPTVAPTITVAGMAAPQGSLGAGVVKGTLSATGLSILLIDAVGEEGIIQAVRQSVRKGCMLIGLRTGERTPQTLSFCVQYVMRGKGFVVLSGLFWCVDPRGKEESQLSSCRVVQRRMW